MQNPTDPILILSDRVKHKILFVSRYVSTLTNDWLLIKRQLINAFAKEDRALFSRRHPRTKKQLPNDFDRVVMDYWKELTGVEVYLNPERLHDSTWIYKPKGWKLRLINTERKQSRENRKNNEK